MEDTTTHNTEQLTQTETDPVEAPPVATESGVGEKRERPEDVVSEEPEEKRPKIDESDATSPPEANQPPPEEVTTAQPEEDDQDLAQFAASIQDIVPPKSFGEQPTTSHLNTELFHPIPADPSSIIEPVVPTFAPRRRRPKTIEEEYEYEPDSKWNKIATERLVTLHSNLAQRRVIDEKIQNEIFDCLQKGANPAVTLASPDGMSFFTFLSVAAEHGIDSLVKHLLTTFESEFSDFDKKHALQSALRNRRQEIAEFLIRQGAPIDREALLLVFDIHMSDELDRKILPLIAILDLIDEGKFDSNELFIPDILNQAISANNVAALELLFERKPEFVKPLLVQATPVSAKTIRPGRGKAQDIGEGVPPLAYAAIMERGECLEVFLRHGADPNFSVDELGGTLLHMVGLNSSNVDLIELLIEYKADPRIQNKRGLTVLSRTKGRKARKYISDAIARFEAMEQHHYVPSIPILPPIPADEGIPEHMMSIPPPGTMLPHPVMMHENFLPPHFQHHHHHHHHHHPGYPPHPYHQ